MYFKSNKTGSNPVVLVSKMAKKSVRRILDLIASTYKKRKTQLELPLNTVSTSFCKNLIVEGYIEHVRVNHQKKSLRINIRPTFNIINALHSCNSPVNLKIIKNNNVSIKPFAVSIVAKANNGHIERLMHIR